MRSFLVKTMALSIAAMGVAPSAFAVLDRAGPVDPANGFPMYYVDKNGVALELCINTNAAVLAAGGCAVLPSAPPAGVLTVPEVFPKFVCAHAESPVPECIASVLTPLPDERFVRFSPAVAEEIVPVETPAPPTRPGRPW